MLPLFADTAESVTGVPIGTVTTIVTAVLGALTTAIGILWKRDGERDKKTETRLEKTESRNVELVDKVMGLHQELGEVKGRQDGIEQLCQMTLKTVRDAVEGAPNEPTKTSGAD